MNILVVDDDKIYLELMSMILKKSFKDTVEVFFESDPLQALEMTAQKDIDLILLDLYMPKMDGFEVAKRLKEDKGLGDVPIVFITAAGYEEFEKKGFDMGSVDYISKPIEKNTLINRVGLYKKLIDKNRLLQSLNKDLNSEVARISDINRMQEQMMIHNSKGSVVSEMMGAIAHQWRQPLNIIATSIMSLEAKAQFGELDIEAVTKTSNQINTTLERLSKTIDGFRSFFLSSKEKERIDMKDIVNSVIELIEEQFETHSISIEFEHDKEQDYFFEGYYNETRQAVLNIFANSKDAIEERMIQEDIEGLIKIELTKEKELIVCSICDNGGGVEPEKLSRIFNPYFTTKFEEQGKGTGLFMVKNIIEKINGGVIEAKNSGEGMCILMRIPI